jgi:hypothetical protein
MRSTSRIKVYHIVLEKPLVEVSGMLFFSRSVKICSNTLNALIRLFYMMVSCALHLASDLTSIAGASCTLPSLIMNYSISQEPTPCKGIGL